MRPIAYLLVLASLAFAAAPVGVAPAATIPAEGHYAGETSPLFLGPAQVRFQLRDPDQGRWKVEGFFCGCGVGTGWGAEFDNGRLLAISPDPSGDVYQAALIGWPATSERISGEGRVRAPWGNLQWTWAATRVPELGPAEADAEELEGLAEDAGELVGALADEGDAADARDRAPTGLADALGALSGRVVEDARHAARVEGRSQPDPYGAPADASARTRAAVARPERDAARTTRGLRRRARTLEAALRRIAARTGLAHPRQARRLRALARRIGREVARIRREIGETALDAPSAAGTAPSPGITQAPRRGRRSAIPR